MDDPRVCRRLSKSHRPTSYIDPPLRQPLHVRTPHRTELGRLRSSITRQPIPTLRAPATPWPALVRVRLRDRGCGCLTDAAQPTHRRGRCWRLLLPASAYHTIPTRAPALHPSPFHCFPAHPVSTDRVPSFVLMFAPTPSVVTATFACPRFCAGIAAASSRKCLSSDSEIGLGSLGIAATSCRWSRPLPPTGRKTRRPTRVLAVPP